MKKTLIKSFASLFMLAVILLAGVSPAFAAGERSITFSHADFIEGKGIVLIFNVTGSYDSFEGNAIFGGQNFPLNCVLKDNGQLACTVGGGAGKFAGLSVTGSLNGNAFSASTPLPVYCYAVYDYSYDDNDVWENIGTHCQNKIAQEGDEIDFYNGFIWNGTYTYTYMTPSWLSCVDFGDAFYYDGCG